MRIRAAVRMRSREMPETAAVVQVPDGSDYGLTAGILSDTAYNTLLSLYSSGHIVDKHHNKNWYDV